MIVQEDRRVRLAIVLRDYYAVHNCARKLRFLLATDTNGFADWLSGSKMGILIDSSKVLRPDQA